MKLSQNLLKIVTFKIYTLIVKSIFNYRIFFNRESLSSFFKEQFLFNIFSVALINSFVIGSFIKFTFA